MDEFKNAVLSSYRSRSGFGPQAAPPDRCAERGKWALTSRRELNRMNSFGEFALRLLLHSPWHGLRRFLRSGSQGQALVEMAFTLPIMMLMITGMASFGLLLNSYLMLSHATDVGARYIALNQGNFGTAASTNPCAMAATQIQAAAGTLAASNLSYTFTFYNSAGSSTGSYSSSNGTGSFGSGSACASGGSTAMGLGGGSVSVQLSYPFLLTVYGWAPSSMPLQAVTTEIIQ